MNELTLHPNVYATGQSKGLISLLERVWVREHTPGDGTMYVMSGFANYNGGVRFFPTFKQHVDRGGNLIAMFSGSTSARLTSRQVVAELLSCGAQVFVINRKRLLHAKCYGAKTSRGESLIVTSGNFTGPGMSQNVEISLLLDAESTNAMQFSWDQMMSQTVAQQWDFYEPSLADLSAPGWNLLYDEVASNVVLDATDEVTMLLRLSHADTARINAQPGSNAALGSQYFWLSKDCFDFFPPLVIRNDRGHKATFSCVINLYYVDLVSLLLVFSKPGGHGPGTRGQVDGPVECPAVPSPGFLQAWGAARGKTQRFRPSSLLVSCRKGRELGALRRS
jgi:hypothetical protein